MAQDNEQSLINVARIIRDIFISDNNGIAGYLARTVPGFRTKKSRSFVFESELQADILMPLKNSDFDCFVTVYGRGYRRKKYQRDEYFKISAIDIHLSGGKSITFTILDVVKFLANKMGGVYLDFKKNREQD